MAIRDGFISPKTNASVVFTPKSKLMHVRRHHWMPNQGWTPVLDQAPFAADLVLFFGTPSLLMDGAGPMGDLRRLYPNALRAGASTAGEISGTSVADGSLSVLLIRFGSTRVKGAMVRVSEAAQSIEAGTALGRELSEPGLRHVLVFSDGLLINGSQLTHALSAALPEGVLATGGLAADGAHFKQTVVGLGDDIGPGRVVALGFIGDQFRVGHGSAGGWQPFGPKRIITRAKGNVLYMLDDQPALALYKRYLGERAAGLPATGLLFPLQLLSDVGAETGLVRTILGVDEEAQSLTFAGDMPEGYFVRLMRAGCDALVDGAAVASSKVERAGITGDRAAILVSCVGRKLVMGQRVEEEVEAVLQRLGPEVYAAGFYSYGEISPLGDTRSCELHNQTMTLTVFGEQI